MMIRIEIPGWESLDICHIAVSYTHLDVYKRQGWSRAGVPPHLLPGGFYYLKTGV